MIALHLSEVQSTSQRSTLLSLVSLWHDVGEFSTINTAEDNKKLLGGGGGGEARLYTCRCITPT